MADSLFRFARLEAEVNALGYQFLSENRLPQALLAFRVGANAYPRSANTWDSLAEALVVAGKRDEGIAMYRKALAIDSTWAPSRQALDRLGVRDSQR
jgi:tetratricopeptide (TPR) repeat protein